MEVNQKSVINDNIKKWKEELIDLSKRNRLLNFKASKYSTLRIIDEQPPEVYRFLVQNLQQMEFLPVKVNEANIPEEDKKSLEELNEGIEFKAKEFKEYNIENLDKKHVDKFLQTNLSEQDLKSTLTKISTNVKTTNDDLGYNVLYLALGSIIWYENDNSDEKFESPVILVPVEIKRKSMGQPYTIKYNEDSVIFNPALTLKLKRDFGINFDDISFDENEISPIDVFIKVQEKIKNKFRWKLLNNIYIGLFSFAKFVMYKDLDEYQGLIKNSKLVGTICGLNDEKQVSTDSICPLSELDKRVQPQATYQILDADSSQQQAIQVVKAGHNLVIEGPPGTGKSQTIANMIAELLSQNKKVLFVSQKMAALNVVRMRLYNAGLASYCLELHSNKTNKKQVVKELCNTIKYINEPNGYFNTNVLSKLSSDIENLKSYSEVLHKQTGALQYKPFDAIGYILKNSHIPDLNYIFEDYDKWTEDKLNENKNLFTNLKGILKNLGQPENFAWYGAEIRDLKFEDKVHLKDKIASYIKNLDNLVTNITELKNEILLKNITKPVHINVLLDIAETVKNIQPTAISAIDDAEIINKINTIYKDFQESEIYSKKVENKYNLEILNENLENLVTKFENYKKKFISRITFKYYKDCKLIKQYLNKGYKPNLKEIVDDLKILKELKVISDKLKEYDVVATKLYGEAWSKAQLNADTIKLKNNYLLRFKERLSSGKYFAGNILEKISSGNINLELIKILTNKIKDIQNSLDTDYNKIKDITQFNCDKAFAKDYNNTDFIKIKNKFIAMLDSIDNLTLWFKYLDLTDKIEKAKLKDFWDNCVENNISLDEYDIALETQFLRTWLEGFVFENNKILKDFNSLDHNNLVKNFKMLDEAQIAMAKDRILSKLSSEAKSAIEEYPDEINYLNKLDKLKKIPSIRKIIRDIPNVFLALKPCLMMSPTTVAQFIDPNIYHFDVIIFDEASQLTVEDCIGSIIRADNIVVAGDTKQLPPTSFFQTMSDSVEYDEYNEEEDSTSTPLPMLDSILDQCANSEFPKCMLRWHYRSKHEHLIAFSNKHFYDEKLYTFPCCVNDSETLGIKFLYHEPSNTLIKENKRLEEAQIVARAVIEHAKKHPDLSLGVATLNIKQKGLIESEIEKLREENPDCENFFNNNNQEYFFVKNLESIQGDERDVIMISIGYFKEENGILKNNFGPINKEGGERRLNVLITRARYMIKIYSGIKASDFHIDKSNSQGLQLLQWYLDFAERGEDALKQEIKVNGEDDFDSPFEIAVCKALRDRGYLVKTQIGCSGYRIDLAIIDKNNPSKFLLGIECDGATYHSGATVRDRDRLRQEVLESLRLLKI